MTGEDARAEWDAAECVHEVVDGACRFCGVTEDVVRLRHAAEHAPASGRTADGLRGVKTQAGSLVCVRCSGRILARGLGHMLRGEQLWTDRAGPTGSCVVCGGTV